MRNPPMVTVENLTVKFDDFIAVNNTTFQVEAGEVLGILGGNGAGKSTTMKVLGGILKPTEGLITVDGYNLRKPSEGQKIKQITGYCPDVGGLIPSLTPKEHAELLLTLHQKEHKWVGAEQLITLFGLDELKNNPVSGFSHGQSRRTSVMLATLASQKVLILDEPFDGVDPIGVVAINEVVEQAKQAGLAVIISTHLQNLLVGVADTIMVMNESEIVSQKPAHFFARKKGEKRYKRLLQSK